MSRATELKDRLYGFGGILFFAIVAFPFVAFIFLTFLTPEILKWTP